MKTKPKILVLCPDIPYPEKGGGQVRMTSIILALTKFADVKVAFISGGLPDELQQWSEDHHFLIHHYDAPPAGILENFRDKLALMVTVSNLRLRRDVKRFFDQSFEAFQPDLVWVETPYLLRYALDWQNLVPVVVDYWGTSEGARRIHEYARGWDKLKARLHWQAARRGELRYAAQIKNIVCVSDQHAAYFQAVSPGSHIQVIPIGLQSKSAPSPLPSKKQNDPETMIISGDMSFFPNVDAALFFVNKIFPRIRKQFPQCKIRLAGRNPDPRVTALNRIEGVEVTGFVPDLSQAIAASAIYVLPLRLGSGFRTKLLDVFSIGKPVVITTIGAEGINLRHNENCLIADSAEEFAEACCRLLGNSQLCMQLSTEVRKLAVKDYAQQNIERLVKQTLWDILENQLTARNIHSSNFIGAEA